jgi:PHD/YefM family antitoxin component YafN of YafNO toxin-antitoxin module
VDLFSEGFDTLVTQKTSCYNQALFSSNIGIDMLTETVTFVKENASKLNVDEPLLVTQNGKAKYVVQSFEDYQYQQDSIALLKLVNLAEKSSTKEELSINDAFDID